MYEKLTNLIPQILGLEIDASHIRDTVYRFCADRKDELGNDYDEVLNAAGLAFDCDVMSGADVSQLDGKTVVTLLLAANRKWYWCGDECYAQFIANGSIFRWLLRLKEIDDEAIRCTEAQQPNPKSSYIQETVFRFKESTARHKSGELCEQCEYNSVCDRDVSFCAKAIINETICSLAPRETAVTALHYGLIDGERYSLEEIAEKCGIPDKKERIQQIFEKAIRKLSHPGREKTIRPFVSLILFRGTPYGRLLKSIYGKNCEEYAQNECIRLALSEAKEEYQAKQKMAQDELSKQPTLEQIRDSLSADPENGGRSLSEIPLEALHLSVGSFNLYKKSGVNTLEELTQEAENIIRSMKSFNRKPYDEINRVFITLGLDKYCFFIDGIPYDISDRDNLK